jgi:hypothetical protein
MAYAQWIGGKRLISTHSDFRQPTGAIVALFRAEQEIMSLGTTSPLIGRAAKLIVADNFYDDPDAVRRFALSTQYLPEDQCETLSGQESIGSFYSSQVVTRLESFVGKRISIQTVGNSFGRFRYTPAHHKRRSKIHFDNTDWTGVVYLTPDAFANGGTVFCRHKETGLYGPPTHSQLAELGLSSLEDFDREVVMRDTYDDDKWSQDLVVSMRYNRLVLFRGSEMFHGSTNSFGTQIKDARLTQVFFFNESST